MTFSEKEGIKGFTQAMAEAGLHPQEEIIPDGKIHRFAVGKKGHKDGWYVFHGMAGAFGDWSQGFSKTWSLKSHSLSYEDKDRLKQQLEKVRKASEEEKIKKQEEATTIAHQRWDTFAEEGYSPYLIKKKVDGFGVRFHQNFLILPVRDTAGRLWSLQSIAPDGTKRFLPGGRKKGCFHHIGVLEDGKPIIVAEGYATSASIHMATQQTTVIAFDAYSLKLVIEELKKVYPNSSLIIAGDDDQETKPNVGRKKAEQASQDHNCRLVFPKFKDLSANPTDFNDLHLLEGLEAVKIQIEQTQHILPQTEELLPVPTTLLPVLPFALEMIPEPLQPWVRDIAHRRQCPLDFVAIPALLMIASLIGARCSLKPNARDDWTVVPNLWGGILGDPGTLKSPICSEVLFPFPHLESKAKDAYTEHKAKYEAEKATFVEEKNALERQIKDAVEQNNEAHLKRLQENLANLIKKCPPEPALKRYKVSDTTLEKMHEILSHNPGGVLIYRDELMGFLESWEKKGHESDRSFYLEAWNGDKPYTIDRMGRGTVRAENICVSILGTTQPDKIMAYLTKALTKLDNDGLLQRFQLLVYPDKKPWRLVDERPNSFARDRVFHICNMINEMAFTEHGAKEPEPLYEGQRTIPFFRFSDEAQLFFHDWIKNLQEKLDNNDHPIILQHLSKYRSLMPSLALIFHIIHLADGKKEKGITLESTQQAAACCTYLESHARRIYGMVLDTTFEAFPKLSKAEELLAWMKKQLDGVEIPLTRRFIMRYSKFRSSKDLDLLLSDLIQMGYIQESAQNSFRLSV